MAGFFLITFQRFSSRRIHGDPDRNLLKKMDLIVAATSAHLGLLRAVTVVCQSSELRRRFGIRDAG